MSASTKIIQAAAGVSTGGPAGNAWNVSTAQWLAEDVNYFSVIAQEGSSTGLFFKSDGTKMYVTGQSSDAVLEYNLSASWDVSSASFLQSFDVSSQETTPQALFFKPDGTKMYVVGSVNDAVNEYDLSTAWDVSTASYSQNFSVASQEINPTGLFFKPDGTEMYICGVEGDDVNQYSLSTAWDVSSASYTRTFDSSGQESAPQSIFFKPDGAKMYVSGSGSQSVNEYNLSTAWNISSASYVQSFDLTSLDPNHRSIFFKPDGLNMFSVGVTGDAVFKYDLSSAWDISTASYQEPTTRYFDTSSEETAPQSVFFKPDGLKMYITGRVSDSVHEYDLSTEWDVSTTSFLQSFSVSGQENGPQGLFFKPDGTEMYICGSGGNDVNQYTLSTAWDISSASYTRTFDSSGQEVNPMAVFFKPDGTKMYIIGSGSDAINEYDLSTAWDISSASFLQSGSVRTQDNFPTGLFFKPDGLKVYVTGTGSGTNTESVNEYDLSSAWDVSSLTFLHGFNVISQDIDPDDVFFKPDGLKMYVVGDTTDAIYEYDL